MSNLEETLQEYEILAKLPYKCDDLEIMQLQVLESLYQQALELDIEPHPYTLELDIEVKERVKRIVNNKKRNQSNEKIS